jgi:hypothetical protein
VVALNACLVYVDTLQFIGLILRAIADDLGAIIPQIAYFKTLARAFNHLQGISGLTLDAPKCCMVPLGRHLRISIVDTIRVWLIAKVSRWATMAIKPASEYVGIRMGPASACIVVQGCTEMRD